MNDVRLIDTLRATLDGAGIAAHTGDYHNASWARVSLRPGVFGGAEITGTLRGFAVRRYWMDTRWPDLYFDSVDDALAAVVAHLNDPAAPGRVGADGTSEASMHRAAL